MSLNDCLKLLNENKLDDVVNHSTVQRSIFTAVEAQRLEDKEILHQIQHVTKTQLAAYKGVKGTCLQFFSACKNVHAIGQFISAGIYLDKQVTRLLEQIPKSKDEIKADYFHELDYWVQAQVLYHPQEDECRQEATDAIKTFVNDSDLTVNLYLGRFQLKEVPTPILNIWKVAQLKILIISNNYLQTLPNFFENLLQLEELDLACNEFSIFPEAIIKLTQLIYLDLGKNKLQTIPESIKNLTRLQTLSFYKNQLNNLPDSIKHLTLLEELRLTKNQFTTLPVSIGELSSLRKLDLAYNRNLTELPLSLGSIPALQSIDTEYTEVSSADKFAILNSCRFLRDSAVADGLSSRLSLWAVIGKSRKDLTRILAFPQNDRIVINEWLTRLQGTRDFKGAQQTLAYSICEILHTVISNEEFKVLFMVQMQTNLVCCEDRSAMALNEIYTCWKMIDAPLIGKLELLTSCAKTLALRSVLSSLIMENERESVEIYLYYEIILKDTLKLTSIIQRMAYSEIGKRNYIQVPFLIRKVEEMYLNQLVDLPQLQMLAQEDKLFAACWNAQKCYFNTQLEKIPEPSDGTETSPDFLAYNINCKVILMERSDSFKEHLKLWISLQ